MNLNKLKKNKNDGFTIVEAVIAVFILSISISAMLGLTVSSYSSAKYANNEITANYLMQETVDSIRNSRDTMVFQQNVPWITFLDEYGKAGSTNCFSSNGCNIATESFDSSNPSQSVLSCNESLGSSKIPCSSLKFTSNDSVANYTNYFYSTNGTGSSSGFKRQVKMVNDISKPNEVEVTATVEYPYGTTFKTKTLKMNLLNWHN